MGKKAGILVALGVFVFVLVAGLVGCGEGSGTAGVSPEEADKQFREARDKALPGK